MHRRPRRPPPDRARTRQDRNETTHFLIPPPSPPLAAGGQERDGHGWVSLRMKASSGSSSRRRAADGLHGATYLAPWRPSSRAPRPCASRRAPCHPAREREWTHARGRTGRKGGRSAFPSSRRAETTRDSDKSTYIVKLGGGSLLGSPENERAQPRTDTRSAQTQVRRPGRR